jgi:uncharacterized protein YndB with AHSA1/START domain
MEFGSIEREIRIDAAPETVFDVVSSPRHVAQWWPDEANYASAEPGSAGEIVFLQHGGERAVVRFEVVDAVPPRLFSFRWTHPEGERPRADNSFLVTFELEPVEDGTLLRMTETGFRERGWALAELEATYRDHSTGWDYHLARLAPYVATHVAGAR